MGAGPTFTTDTDTCTHTTRPRILLQSVTRNWNEKPRTVTSQTVPTVSD